MLPPLNATNHHLDGRYTVFVEGNPPFGFNDLSDAKKYATDCLPLPMTIMDGDTILYDDTGHSAQDTPTNS